MSLIPQCSDFGPNLDPDIVTLILTLVWKPEANYPSAQNSLQTVQVTPELFSRPCFRYIYDLVCRISEETGFCRELTTDEYSELHSVHTKAIWLQSIVKYVETATGKSIQLDPREVSTENHLPNPISHSQRVCNRS